MNPIWISIRGQVKKFHNVKEMITAMQSTSHASHDDGHKSYTFSGDNAIVIMDIDWGNPVFIEHARDVDKIITYIPKIIDTLANELVNEYNSSFGKSDPWEWAGSNDSFTRKSKADAKSKLSLLSIKFGYYKDTVEAEVYIDAGSLYENHLFNTDIHMIDGRIMIKDYGYGKFTIMG